MLVCRLTVGRNGDVDLDVTLGAAVQAISLEPGVSKLLRDLTALCVSAQPHPELQVPYGVQALVQAGSLFDALASQLFASVTGDPDLDRVRRRLFS